MSCIDEQIKTILLPPTLRTLRVARPRYRSGHLTGGYLARSSFGSLDQNLLRFAPQTSDTRKPLVVHCGHKKR
ncbi:MAG: hypothetical protein KKD69_08795 [Euryarchaeota archaeon]|nr:hypothetical protein [Euryarchaeota archaeon]